MGEICGDNRFELIEKYKTKLIEATNIETAKDEMAVIDSILFRFWQMGWLDKLEADVVPKSEVEKAKQEVAREIFEEIWKIVDDCNIVEKFKEPHFNLSGFVFGLAELKKKYTESEDTND